MKPTCFLPLLFLVLLVAPLYAQIGLGTSTPKAFVQVPNERTVLFGNDTSFAGGVESKLIWYGSQGAFRVGAVTTPNWNRANASDIATVGLYSFASGVDTKASGRNSTVMGYLSTASGDGSVAIGTNNQASGLNSVVLGISSRASAYYSIALGNNAMASGDYSLAMGHYISTDSRKGSFILGDQSEYKTSTGAVIPPTVFSSTADNQMMMRFVGGYMLYSTTGRIDTPKADDQSRAIGVKLPAGANAWTTLSDSARKENFRSANGSSFLQKIAGLRLGSWNYKGQDAHIYRHYGPMAQEFFAAFGHDELGTIGEDKSINQADFDGVNLIAIQALIHEVNQLKKEANQLKAENSNLHQRVESVDQLQQETASLRSELESIKRLLSSQPSLSQPSAK